MKILASFIELICMLAISLPIAVIAYLWCWVLGGWAAGNKAWDMLHWTGSKRND